MSTIISNLLSFSTLYIQYVRFQLIVQNAVSAQPCVGKLGISHILLNFLIIIIIIINRLGCNFRW